MSDRCFNGTLHSNERLYLDKLWQGLEIDPLDERVSQLEGRLIASGLRCITERFRELRIEAEKRGLRP
jgi:hypothetical protein